VCALLVLSVSLGSLVQLGGVTTTQRELVLLVLLTGLILALPGGRLRTTIGRGAAICAFVGCTAVSYLRFAAAPIAPVSSRVMIGLALMLFIVTAFALCALLAPANPATRRRRLLCALFSPVCFVVLDLFLYAVGFHFPTLSIEGEGNEGPAQILGLIGIHATRADLPLSPGLNGTGEAAALSLVICVTLAYRGRGRLRLVSLLGVPASLTVVLLTDSRGPMVYALLALIMLAVLPKASKRVVAAIPILLPISSAIVLFVVGHLGGISESLNRNPGSGSFETATGRSQVWSIVGNFLSHPHVEDLVGYGAYGQVRSGVGLQYAYLFSYKAHPEFTSVHNIALQTILDTGYIGLAFFVWFLVVAINSARVSHQEMQSPESAALLAALIALTLFGASEALPGLAGIYLLVSVIILACAAIRVMPTNAYGRATTSRFTAEASSIPTTPRALAR
jgi:hypothetical protein